MIANKYCRCSLFACLCATEGEVFHRGRARLLAFLVAALIATAFWRPAAWAEGSVGKAIELELPVTGGVLRSFDASGRFAPGHRGLDLGAPRESPVHASAGGRVIFAGAVAGNTAVTIAHPGGWQTTYSYLARSIVQKGAEVGQGEVIGSSGAGHLPGKESLHFSLRLDGDYLDPSPYFRGQLVHLSESNEAKWAGPVKAGLIDGALMGSGIAATADVAADFGRGFLDAALEGADWASRSLSAASSYVTEVAERARGAGLNLARSAVRIAVEAGALASGLVLGFDQGLSNRVRERAREAGRRLEQRAERWLDHKSAMVLESLGRTRSDVLRQAKVLERMNAHRRSQRDCTEGSGEEREKPSDDDPLVVLVGGFGSELATGGLPFDIDLASAGIRQDDAIAFSYSGYSQDPAARRPMPNAYSPADTWGGISRAAELLARFLSEIRRHYPRRKVTVVAHSQGGVVARKALLDSSASGVPPPPADRLVTIGSPHQGSRIANRISVIRDTTLGARAVDAAGRSAEIGTGSQSLRDLAEGSEIMREMGSRLPSGIPVTSIAAAEDFVVPATQSWLRGADNVLISTGQPGAGAHSGQLRNKATMHALHLALRGQVPCQEFADWLSSDKKSALIDEAIGGVGEFAAQAARGVDLQ